MQTLLLKDLPRNAALDRDAMATVRGARNKLPHQQVSPGDLLTNNLGDPVAVYVDGLLINSPTTGYAPR
jgi:hypothetical protein